MGSCATRLSGKELGRPLLGGRSEGLSSYRARLRVHKRLQFKNLRGWRSLRRFVTVSLFCFYFSFIFSLFHQTKFSVFLWLRPHFVHALLPSLSCVSLLSSSALMPTLFPALTLLPPFLVWATVCKFSRLSRH